MNRNFLAIAILILGSAASFYCYMRLAKFLVMSDVAAHGGEMLTLRALMILFALIAMIAPFGVMKHGA